MFFISVVIIQLKQIGYCTSNVENQVQLLLHSYGKMHDTKFIMVIYFKCSNSEIIWLGIKQDVISMTT